MKRSRPKPVSDKRRAENVIRAAMLEEKYGPRGEWQCSFRMYLPPGETPDPCFGEINGHELVKASAWRGGRLEPSNVVTLCNHHNGWIEDHPNEARELVLVRRRAFTADAIRDGDAE